ncbi:MAG: hypothetical protein H0X66_10550 [Verrucomicrobia bacterium]|nr:hypothetical protein [Verrucomicrobiota bacterium]
MQSDNPQITTQEPSAQEPTWNEFPESLAGQEAGKTREVAEEVRRTGAETMRRTKEQGEAFLGEQKHTVAETLHHCGDALRGAAGQLREKQDQNLASIAESIAARLDKTSNYLDGKQLQDIRNDVENFARKQPQVFYGSMFVAGLALSRFFKASKSGQTGFAESEAENINQ